MMFLGIVLFNCTPLYKNYRAGLFSDNPPENLTFEHAVYYELPFDAYTNKRGYIIIFSFNWIASYFCSASFCTFDLFLSLQIFHLWGHLKILKYNFENFPRPNVILNLNKEHKNTNINTEYSNNNTELTAEMYNSSEMVRVFKLLEEYIEHHKLILE